jgi:3'(2'), 5'-bisphosphate nucleotidase
VTPEPISDAALAADLAEEAGKLLLAVRDRVGFDHPWLLGDEGDSQANALLLKRLHAERPGDAVLSEEAYDDLNRLQSDRVWIVDPLDGTREFSWEGRDDWAVHVALWQRHGGPNGAITDAAVAWPGNSTWNSSGSARPEPKRCRWFAATPTHTSTRAGSGSGTRPPRRA